MQIRAKANGDVIDVSDDGARTLVDAGIYDAVVEPMKTPPAKTPPTAPTHPAPEKSTKVAPMTTEDMPTAPAKKAK
jgi:hypothetical protein